MQISPVPTLLFQGPVRLAALHLPDSPAPTVQPLKSALGTSQTVSYLFEWASRESHPEVVASYDLSGKEPKR